MRPLLDENGLFYAISLIDNFLPEDEPYLPKRVQRSIMHNGEISHELAYQVIGGLSSNQEILDEALSSFCTDFLSECHGIAGETLKETKLLLRSYATSRNILSPHYVLPSHIQTGAILHKNKKYDAIIGIAKGGLPVPIVMHALGSNVGFIRVHKNWRRAPIWVKRCELRHGMSVLLCEDDAVSGETLRSAVKKISDSITPSTLDVCFSGYNLEDSIKTTEEINEISAVITTEMIPKNQIYTNLLAVKNKLISLLE